MTKRRSNHQFKLMPSIGLLLKIKCKTMMKMRKPKK